MPVIADLDEPPAKCCKFCDESTHSVDEPESWRLTLDQDLIDTLKGSFPNWFTTNNPANNNSAASSSPSSSSTSSSSSSSSSASSIQSEATSKILLPVSDSSCKGLLAQISTADQLYKQIIFEKTFDGMAEGDHLGNPSTSSLLESSDGGSPISYDFRPSPPKAIVDSSPLQPAMDKNKESLKVKLMVRRPITQLVEQGIIPPLKTSPAIHEQCKQLERAKTGDLLKAKIQQRPNREELERRHILEYDESHVDPSLAEKQRMLKKARLADQLNSQISHRPGPLELIKKNILHTEKPIERIVKEGLVSFKATSEGLLTRPQQPHSYITFEDDSQSSESDTRNTPPRQNVLEAAAASAGIVTVALTIPTSDGQVVVTSAPILETKFHPTAILTQHQLPQLHHLQQVVVPPPPPPPPPTLLSTAAETTTAIASTVHPIIQVKQDTSNLFAELCQSVAGPSSSPGFLPLVASPASLGSSASTLSPLSSISSPPQSLTPRPIIQSPALQLQQIQPQQQQQSQKSDAPGKDKNRKKSKSKPITKARTIKFHEYKGPPSSVSAAQKMVNTTTSNADPDQSEETSYQLMLEQQNCLLKFLENLNKNQSILTNNSTKNPTPNNTSTVSNINESVSTNSNQNIQQNHILHHPNTPHPPPMPSPGPLSVSSSIAPPSPAPSSCYAESICSTATNSSSAITDISKLEKMKVSDLKLQLKKRNLPVSGPKPQLIERLKPYLPLEPISIVPASTSSISSSGEMMTICGISNETCDASDSVMIVNSPRNSLSPESNHPENMDIGQQIDSPYSSNQNQNMIISLENPTTNNDLVREQQRKIDELQRQLEKSQQELQQIKQIKQQIVVVEQQPKQLKQNTMQQQPPTAAPPTTIQPINQKMVVKQQLEAKIQKQQAKAQALAQAQAEAQLLLNMKSKPAPPLIIPKDDTKSSTATIITTTTKQIPIATINKPQQQQQQHQNLSFVWGDNQTIYLVGLPQQNNDTKKLFNGYQQRTLSLPSMVFPVSAMQTGQSISTTTTQQHFIETKPPILQQLKSQPPALIIKREQPQQIQQQQQQQIITKHIQIDSKQPPPLYKEIVKQEPKQQLITKIKKEPIEKKNLKSENLTDVLDILIKNGELSESALNTPTTPSGNPALITSSDGILFTANNKNHQQRQQQQHNDIMDVVGNHDNNVESSSTFQNTLLLNTPLNIDNIDITSPLQTDCHIDVDTKTFDVFLDQKTNLQFHSDSTNNIGSDDDDDNNDLNHLHTNHNNNNNNKNNDNNEINHFDDLELLELMSQQLDMDIGEETCHNFPSMVIDNNSAINNSNNGVSQQQQQQQQQQQHKSLLNTRRDMNPSLQPSINELIQQQQHHNTTNNNNNFHHNLLTNDSDVNSVTGGIGDGSNSGSNGFDSSHFNLSTNCNNNFSSTPMDVCDDFDNPLASLGFGTNFSPDSNINTPPHPFSSGLSNNSNDGFCSGSVSGGGPNSMLLSGGSGQQQLYHNNLMNNQICASNGCGGNSSSNDSFSTHLPISQDNILDLFNIDDFKMSTWGGVDYAV